MNAADRPLRLCSRSGHGNIGKARGHAIKRPDKPGRNELAWERMQREGTAFYRKYTEVVLRRFGRLSLRAGKMPSLLGKDMVNGTAKTYRINSFEDSVIFVYDMEKCISLLDNFSRQLIEKIALQEHTQGEAARLMGISLRTAVRRYGEALDELTCVLLDRGLMKIEHI
jgi:hypothetical protein